MRIHACRWVAFWLGIVALPSQVNASHPATTDDAGIVQPSAYELELAAQAQPGSAKRAFGIGLRRGFSATVDAGCAFASAGPAAGEEAATASAVDLKWSPVQPAGRRPGVFLRADLTLTRGDAFDPAWAGFGCGFTAIGSTRAVSMEFSSDAAALSEFSQAQHRGVSVALFQKLGPNWEIVGEFVRFGEGIDRDESWMIGAIRSTPIGALSGALRLDPVHSDVIAAVAWTLQWAPDSTASTEAARQPLLGRK